MSAHLQFGPEWMRKAPAKNAAAPGTEAAAATAQNGSQASANTTAPPSAVPGGAARPDARRKASGTTGLSLGTNFGQGSVSAQGMPTPTTPSAHGVVSPGAFSFAAAAGGAAGQQATGSSRERASSSAVGLAGAGGAEGDPMRYSKRLLSLYNTEGQKAAPDASSQQSPVHGQQIVPPSGPASAVTPTRKKTGGAFDRDGRRNHGTPGETSGTVGLNGEPRGLNARAIGAAGSGIGRGAGSSSNDDKYMHQRPGLFQRGSSNSAGLPAMNLSPTSLQHYRERERHGAGIQGGVLSSVAPGARKSKDGSAAPEGDALPRDADSSSMDRPFHRATNEAFASVGRSRQSSYRSNAGILAPVQNSSATNTTEQSTPAAEDNDEPAAPPPTKEEWVRLRKERLPNDGPLGPPADHSGGFTRYYGLDRKRERQPRRSGHQASSSQDMSQRHAQSARGPVDTAEANGNALQEQLRSSNDMDLPQHAYNLVEALKIDDDEDQLPQFAASPEAARAQMQQPPWSAEEAEWLYKDPSGQVQGPFKANVMQEWYAAKYFTNELLVRPAEVDVFKPLGMVLGEIGNTDVPFLLPPSQYRVNAMPRPQDLAAAGGFGHLLPGSRQQSSDSMQFARGPSEWTAGPFLPQHGNNAAFGGDALRQSPFVSSTFGGIETSSPFGTPPASFAELGGSARQRQQEDYLAMIRQRELAEFRAMQEMQRHGELSAGGMNNGGLTRQDSASAFRSWNGPQGGLTQPNEWGSPIAHAQSRTFMPPLNDQRFQDMPRPIQFGSEQTTFQPAAQTHREQSSTWNATQVPQQQQSSYQTEDVIEQSNPSQSNDAANVTSDTLATADNVAVEEKPEKKALVQEEVAPSAEPAQEPTPIEEDDENSPERLWPQSPKAVEFASESPIPAEDTTSLEEFTTKGKRNRRDKKRRDEQDLDLGSAHAKATARTPANVNVVSEEQFRRSQASRARTAGQGASLVPLMSDATPSTPSAPKAAPWANSAAAADTNAGLSLREIQEAEERRAGALKASLAERKQRAQAQSTSSASDANLPTSMSWGLASVPSNISAANTAAAASENTQAAGPVWNAGSRNAPKKTLTEIQEEERKRTQKLRDAQAASTASPARGSVGKAYADSAVRTQPVAAANPPAGWSVVGAGGKPSTPAASAAAPSASSARPVPAAAMRSASSSGLAGGALSGWSTAGTTGKTGAAQVATASPMRSAATASSAAKSTSASGSSEPTPSAGFIQYCKEQLKGIRSVSLDHFIEMLMQFPLDADNDTIEIIAEMVYANSSTLDGRRFAHDFVAKRKLDAAGRTGSTANGRGVAARSQGIANGALSGTPATTIASAASPRVPATATSSQQPRSASDVLRSDASAAKAGSDSFGGFKVVKGKGNKKRV